MRGEYILLLEEFLGEILQVSTRKLGAIGNDNNLPTITRNSNSLA
jgi:hypothetical protein